MDEAAINYSVNLTDYSVLPTQEKQNLKFWGLPESILKQYQKHGIVSMFPWQVECLCCGNVLKGGNLVYSAPTSAGKTLVAEILSIKTVLERKKKVIIILPFVSVVREKMFYFKDLLSGCAMQVAGLMGSHSLPGGFKCTDIAICTIEKANSLINRLLEEESLYKVGAVIVDELHLLGDPFRGYLLELLLTKILYMQKMNSNIQIQVIGMSATLPNLDLLASWLGADLYTTNFRPVPLQEFLKIDSAVYDSQLKKLYNIKAIEDIQEDPDHVVQMCLETVIGGHSVLIFCATKSWCEKLAKHIAQIFRTVGFSGGQLADKIRQQLNSTAILEAIQQLQRCPVGIDKILRGTVAFGVAFHHAGLTLDERDIIEGCFRAGILKVIVATSTLSSGVNLPAHRVIIRSPVFHGKPLDVHIYRQMIGRAGRMGHNTAGESFLLCHKSEQKIGESLIKAELTSVESCLGHTELTASLKRAILEVIASGVASTPEQVSQYTSCTLLATSKTKLENPVSACVHFLEKNEFIRLQEKQNGNVRECYVPTPLGLACLAASLPPDEGLQLFDELTRARQCFVLDTDLHIVYEVTPYSVSMQWGNLDWLQVLNLWEELPAAMKKVGELVGVDERFMIRAMRGTLSLNTSKQIRKMSVHRRFYTALALYELVNEVPLNEVARKFGCSRGMLQSLQQSSATFAGMVTAFCRRLGWSTIELLVSQFQDRLQFGVQRELCELMRLDNLNGQRARALFNAGITSISELAAADVNVVENILHSAVPFQSAKEIDGETTFDAEQRKKFRAVWITGKHGVTEKEAASMLISDARSFLQKELGLADAKWDADESDSSKDQSNDSSNISTLSSQSLEPVLHYDSVPSQMKHFKPDAKNLKIESDEECLSASPASDVSVYCNKGLKKSKEIQSRLYSTCKALKKNLNNSRKIVKNPTILKTTQKNHKNSFVPEDAIRNNNHNATSKLVELKLNCKTYENFKSSLSYADISQNTDGICSNVCTKQNKQTATHDMEENSISIKITETFLKNIDKKVEDIKKEFSKTAFIKSHPKSEQETEDICKNTEKQQLNEEITCNDTNEEHVLTSFKASKIQRKDMSNSPDKVAKEMDYKSPSLFGDSFILDTQLDNVLANCSAITECHESSFCHENDKSSRAEYILANAEIIKHKELEALENENVNYENNEQNGTVDALDRHNYSEIEPLRNLNSILDSKGRRGIVLQLPESPSIEILHSINFEDINFETLTSNSEQNGHISSEDILDSLNYEKMKCSPVRKRKLQGDNTINTKQKKMCNENIAVCRKENGLNGNENNNAKDLFCKGEYFSENSKLNSKTHDGIIHFNKEKSAGVEEKEETLVDNGKDDVITDSFLEKAFDTYMNMSLQSTDEISLQSINCDIDSPTKSDKSYEQLCNLSDKKAIEQMLITSWELGQDFENGVTSNLGEDKNMDANNSKTVKHKITHISSERKHKLHTTNSRRRSPRLIAAASRNQHSSLESKVRNSKSSSLLDNTKQNDLLLKCPSVQLESIYKPKVLLNESENNCDKEEDLIASSQAVNMTMDAKETRDWNTISIVDVCKNKQVWTSFQAELQQKGIETAMAVACEQYKPNRDNDGGIGARIMRKSSHRKAKISTKKTVLCHGNRHLVGLAFCFGGKDVYYIDLTEGETSCISERLSVLENMMSFGWELRTFDLKEQTKALYHCCNLKLKLSAGHDPKIADWLLEPESKEKTLHTMASKYCTSEISKLLTLIGSSSGVGSPALDFHSSISGRLRSCVEALLVWKIVEAQHLILDELGLKTIYSELEMPTLFCLTQMELTGIGFNREEAERLRNILEKQMAVLEMEAYRLAGHTFSLTSSSDVAKVLYRELKLTSGKSSSNQRCPGTSKEALTRIKADHPLPGLILQWRKLNAMITKTVFPLLRAVQHDNKIFGCSVMHTATGRISMHEPNLQNIPRDFEVVIDSQQGAITGISMRTAFVPESGKVFVSADYCQLELRLLAHLAKDDILCSILNSGEDVFCNIASSWRKVPTKQVTPCQRQWAKQICYGMIYGIGARALSEQLDVEEEEAAVYMDTFKNSYPGVKYFLTEIVSRCRKEGYIETLMSRRRYLPSICASHAAARAQAERQAINSTVQGSAADVVKKGMILVEKCLLEAGHSPTVCLVLHLHDELLYEVPQEKSLEVARLIKNALENAVKLSVKLPVKLKVGNSWGSLTEIILPVCHS